MLRSYFLVFILFAPFNRVYAVNKNLNLHLNQGPSNNLPPCRACKILVKSFEKGLERTSKFKFEGGDTAWEEEKLGSYATSEIRFVEIHEKICSEVDVGKDQCYNILEEYEETLETWWFSKQKDQPDLYKYLCIETYEVCCPENHYGTNCTPCKGYPDNICNNNGKCKGAGTRKGNGQCHCNPGYSGDSCDQCADKFYESYRDDKKLLCSPCHHSCEGSCTEAGVIGCAKCKGGWVKDEEKGCVDINECARPSACTPLQFCVNSEGSFRCLDCDRSCAGCTGDGPDMCINCASGYYKKDNTCIDAGAENRKQYMFFTRYLTYLGLCLCPCIVFNRSTYLAAIIGVCVGMYITVSEYMLNNSTKSDIREQVAEQVMKSFQ